jgi:outer membrane assembly lipoprotein YfiO
MMSAAGCSTRIARARTAHYNPAMRKLLTCLTLLLILTLWTRASLAEPQTWDLKNGKYWEPAKTATTQPIADATLDRIEQLLANKQPLAAKRQALTWVKSHKKSPARDRGLFLLAQANFVIGNRLESFYEFEELMDLYPDSSLFNASLGRQYDIANGFVNGYKRRFLGLALFSAEDEGIEMLYRIQQRSPGSPLAEKALLRTGDYYYSTSDFDLATDVYAAFVKSYPRSPEVPRVQLRQAFSYYAQFRGLRFDATPIVDAREKLAGILVEYPKLAEEENILPVIERIDETFARKLYQTADFYRRTDEPKAAVYLWRYLVQTYPKSPEAERARRELTRMPKPALADPAPPAPTVDAR